LREYGQFREKHRILKGRNSRQNLERVLEFQTNYIQFYILRVERWVIRFDGSARRFKMDVYLADCYREMGGFRLISSIFSVLVLGFVISVIIRLNSLHEW
jgi:hypothetical protein